MSDDLNTNRKYVKRNWICDECGEYFIVGDEGEVTAGFGTCNKCWEEITKPIKLKKSKPYYYNKKTNRYLSRTQSGNREYYFRILSKIAEPLYFEVHSTFGKIVIKRIKPLLKEYKVYSDKLITAQYELKTRIDKEIASLISEKERTLNLKREQETTENARSSDLYNLTEFLAKYSFVICAIIGVGVGYENNNLNHFLGFLFLGMILFPPLMSVKEKIYKSFENPNQIKKDKLELETYKKDLDEIKKEKYSQDDSLQELERLVEFKVKQIQKKIYRDLKDENLKFILSDQFYNSIEWRKLRETILDKGPKMCRKCSNTDNLEVDHIKPRSKYPELALEKTNLQILCRACNRSKSNK